MLDPTAVNTYAKELRPLAIGRYRVDGQLLGMKSFLGWVEKRLKWDSSNTARTARATELLFAQAVRDSAEILAAREYSRRNAKDDDCYIVGIAECMDPVNPSYFNDLLREDDSAKTKYDEVKVRFAEASEEERNSRFMLWIGKDVANFSNSASYHHKLLGMKALVRAVDKLLNDTERVARLLADVKGSKITATVPTEHNGPTRHQSPVTTLPIDDGLLKTAHRLALEIKADLEEQERHHHVTGLAALPVRWAVVEDGRADLWEKTQPRSDNIVPSMLNDQYPGILQTYNLIGSGRLVILGAPGSGKTIVASHLALELLNESLANRRPFVVPVTVNLADWSEHDKQFKPWFAHQLTRRYLIRGKNKSSLSGELRQSPEALYQLATQLIRAGLILPILDGFDEVKLELQFSFVEALYGIGNDHKLILTSRTNEYEAAVQTTGYLECAAVIQNDDLDPDQVLDYLHRQTSARPQTEGESASTWRLLAKKIRDTPTARGTQLRNMLKTPFVVSLARATYRLPRTDPCELLDIEHFPDETAIKNRLLDGYITSAYHAVDVNPQKAKRLLELIARRARENGERDIAWWSLGTTRSDLEGSPVHWTLGIGMPLVIGGVLALFGSSASKATQAMTALDITATVAMMVGFALTFLWFLYFGTEFIDAWHKERDKQPETSRFEQYFDRAFHNRALHHNMVVFSLLSLLFSIFASWGMTPTYGNSAFWFILPSTVVLASLFGLAFVVIPSGLAPMIQARMWFMLVNRKRQGLNAFLEQAYTQGILRRVGRIYQFRHQFLFDYLLGEAKQPSQATPHQRDAKPANESSSVDDGST